MWQELRPALIITRREIRDQFRDWRIIIPIIILTLVFPSLMNFTAQQAVTFVEKYGADLIGDRLIPFLLMVVGFFPISVSLVIALESFVGEKERRTIEPLLSCPLKDWQLYFGKLIAVLVPPLIASYLGIIVYLIGVYRQVGWVPEVILIVQIVLLTTVQALVMVSGAVVISTQTTSVRAANLLASFIIIPVAFLIQGESVVMFWGRYHILWWAILGLTVIAGLLVRTGVSHFNREELLGRELDSINIRWTLGVFWNSFKGGATSLVSWYRDVVWKTLKRQTWPMLMVLIFLIAALFVGSSQAEVFQIPLDMFNLERLDSGVEFVDGFETFQLFNTTGILYVWFHNMRAMLLASLAGLFSFGVLGVIILMLPLTIVGFFMTAIAPLGVTPGDFLLGLIVPHGILEIPAIVVIGAAIVRIGASLAAPGKGKSVGETWILALADWAKIMIGVVVPLLLGAAVIEVLITPQVALRVFGG